MKIVDAHFTFDEEIQGHSMVKRLEQYGRTCYKTEGAITEDSYARFIRMIIKRGHESVLEHEKISVRIICDRGVTHEIVRHRIASYSQESTRYCNYSKDKFGRSLTFIRPCFWEENSEQFEIWKKTMQTIENNYLKLIETDTEPHPEKARSILPNSLKTEIIVTMNLREWRHFFRLRTSEYAHPQMREIARPLLNKFKELVPIVFEDINY